MITEFFTNSVFFLRSIQPDRIRDRTLSKKENEACCSQPASYIYPLCDRNTVGLSH